MTPNYEAVTESELIQCVQTWVAEDEAYDDKMSSEEMLERLQEAIQYRPPESPISKERVEEIVRTYAPGAPHRPVAHISAPVEGQSQPDEYALPPQLEKFKDTPTLSFDSQFQQWKLGRCSECGSFGQEECHGKNTVPTPLTRPEYHSKTSVLLHYGEQAAGLKPIRKPNPPKPIEEIRKAATWWTSFRGADELEDGGLKMYIENFLPEGIILICGLPKEGKSWLALSIVKALTSGKPLFGNLRYSVPERIPVLYLAAEVSDRAFKQRLSKFRITNDKSTFLCRTLSNGPRLGLYHPDIEGVVRNLKPVVILDTVIRFNESSNEDSATENKELADALFYLRSLGARAVIGIHHSRKDLKDGEPTLEKAVRGTGDLAAMCDVVWAIVRDERLYRNNTGPNEARVIGWGRDFNPEPMRLALTKRARKDFPKTVITFAPGITSCIDETGDLMLVDKNGAVPVTTIEMMERLVQTDPAITIRDLAEETGLSYWDVQHALKSRGWTKGRGGRGRGAWKQAQAA